MKLKQRPLITVPSYSNKNFTRRYKVSASATTREAATREQDYLTLVMCKTWKTGKELHKHCTRFLMKGDNESTVNNVSYDLTHLKATRKDVVSRP